MSGEKALVVGATGMVGTRLVEHLAANAWPVLGLCRKPPNNSGPVNYVGADLLNIDECNHMLSDAKDVSHIFYAARAKHGEGGIEPVEENLKMLRNVVDVVCNVSPVLRHVHLVHGA